MKKTFKLLCFLLLSTLILVMAGCSQQQAAVSEPVEEAVEQAGVMEPLEEPIEEEIVLAQPSMGGPPAFVLLWHENQIFMGMQFGDITADGDVVEVVKNGEPLENFTVKSDEPEIMSAEICGPGQICLTKLKPFEGRSIGFTIIYEGLGYPFCCNDDSGETEGGAYEEGPYADAYAAFMERQYTDEELQAFVDADLSFQEACDKLSTVSDVVRYLYLRGYHFSPDDAGIEASTRYKLNGGGCVGGSALLNALLEGDYDEQGYVYIFYARGEHVFDYFVVDGVYFYCDLVGGPFNRGGTNPMRDPVCHITTDPSSIYEAWLEIEPNDLNDSSGDMYLAAMYTTAYCGNPTMPTVWLRDSSTGKYSRIPLRPAEKKSQQILFLRDGYTFEF